MIIHFDTDSSKVTLLQQQNDKKSFVVDFLYKRNMNENKFNFPSIIEKVCAEKEIVKILKKEANTVVLPNDFVCIDTLTVPYEKRDTRRYMLSKFDLLYGGKDKFVLKDEMFSKNRNVATFLLYIAKSEIVSQIVKTFERFGVKIKNISFEASVLAESILPESKQFAKQNFLVVKIGKQIFEFVVLIKGRIFAHDKVSFESNELSKKYAKYVKANYKKLSDNTSVNEKEIEKIRVNLQKNDKTDLLPTFIEDLKEFYRKSDFSIEFDNVIILDENNLIKNVTFGTKMDLDKNRTMYCTGKNYFIERKKGFWVWQK